MDSCLNKKDNLDPTHFTQQLFLVPRSSVDPPNEILKRAALETRTMETEIKDAQLGRLPFNNSENFEMAPQMAGNLLRKFTENPQIVEFLGGKSNKTKISRRNNPKISLHFRPRL